jgi:hypothetical protein
MAVSLLWLWLAIFLVTMYNDLPIDSVTKVNRPILMKLMK